LNNQSKKGKIICNMLKQQIQEQLKKAMLGREVMRVSVLRNMLAGFTSALTASKRTPQDELTDDEALQVIQKLASQRKDSIEQFEKGKREDLAQKEREELKILEEYLPEQMSKQEIEKRVLTKIKELNITDKSQLGKLMGAVMRDLKGRADGNQVKSVVNSLLG
jgi:uncharacterized protein